MITDYKNLTIGQYNAILAVAENEPVEENRNPQILAVLTGKTVAELEAMPIVDFVGMMRKAGFLTVPPKPAKTRKNYACGPFTLVPVLDFKKITTAQYIDFQTLSKRDGGPAIVEVLSCLMIPEGRKYCDGYDPADVQTAIRDNMSVEDAISLYSFFTGRLLSLTRRLATSLNRMARRLPRSQRETMQKTLQTLPTGLQAVGDGLLMLTPFQKLSALIGIQYGA